MFLLPPSPPMLEHQPKAAGRGREGREWEMTVDAYGVSFGGVEKVLKLDHDDGCTPP